MYNVRGTSIFSTSYRVTSQFSYFSGSDTKESDRFLEEVDFGGWTPFSPERFQESVNVAEDFGGWRPFSSERLERRFKNVGNLDEEDHDVTLDDDIEGWVPYAIKKFRDSIGSVLDQRSDNSITATSMGESTIDSSDEDMNNYGEDVTQYFTEGNSLGPIYEEDEEKFT